MESLCLKQLLVDRLGPLQQAVCPVKRTRLPVSEKIGIKKRSVEPDSLQKISSLCS